MAASLAIHSHRYLLTAISFSSSNATVIVASLIDGYLSMFSLNLNLYRTCFTITMISFKSCLALVAILLFV